MFNRRSRGGACSYRATMEPRTAHSLSHVAAPTRLGSVRTASSYHTLRLERELWFGIACCGSYFAGGVGIRRRGCAG